jgi:head-tail adaptor
MLSPVRFAMTPINFSKFDKLCVFLNPEVSLDGFGGYHIDWQPVHNAWAQVVPIIPDKKSQGVRPVHPWTHRLFMRFYPAITEGMRMSYGDETFVIDHVINHEEQSRYLELFLIRREK